MAHQEDIIEQLTGLSHFLGDPVRDLAILGEGNSSARVDDETFYVKASGRQLGTITPDGFCSVAFNRLLPLFDGADLSDAEVKAALLKAKSEDSETMPSVETFFHAFLLSLPNVHFVGHTHPTAVNSILCSRHAEQAFAGRLFPDEIVCCGVAPCYVEYTDPGMVLSKTIRRRVDEFAELHGEYPKVIVMQNHGLIALGKTPRDVESATMMFVKTARVILGTYAMGGPHFLTDEQVSRIHTRPDELYRRIQLEK